jgi:DNA modification methylase
MTEAIPCPGYGQHQGRSIATETQSTGIDGRPAIHVEHLSDNVVLHLGDCREILPPPGKADGVVTDPPYGIGADRGQAARANKKNGNAILASKDYGWSDWDDQPPSNETLTRIIASVRSAIIFGGNYFALPPSRCWLVWDKRTGDNDYADCELAWTNLDKPVRRIEWLWKGMLRKGDDLREHPTQKPEGVMRWCIGHLPPDAQTILDPYMGSGTTGVAAVQLGRKFIGIEIEPKYFDIACRRISDELKRPRLPFEEAKKPVQETMFT